ncbi:hypothetical protein ACRALDRAFT_1093023 [Sodiomyces alcalophilus JCM 7366]|uniref:uncharacterized protein n=1 Tax=Sodiomyces alcalophilus JCM 7366 TaxID=591952 RepID=UPI0039B69BD8
MPVLLLLWRQGCFSICLTARLDFGVTSGAWNMDWVIQAGETFGAGRPGNWAGPRERQLIRRSTPLYNRPDGHLTYLSCLHVSVLSCGHAGTPTCCATELGSGNWAETGTQALAYAGDINSLSSNYGANVSARRENHVTCGVWMHGRFGTLKIDCMYKTEKEIWGTGRVITDQCDGSGPIGVTPDWDSAPALRQRPIYCKPVIADAFDTDSKGTSHWIVQAPIPSTWDFLAALTVDMCIGIRNPFSQNHHRQMMGSHSFPCDIRITSFPDTSPISYSKQGPPTNRSIYKVIAFRYCILTYMLNRSSDTQPMTIKQSHIRTHSPPIALLFFS